MDEKVAFEQLQMLEQNMNVILNQKQQFIMQQAEIEVALAELSKTKTAYKIVGNIMISTDKDNLQKELSAKKEVLNVRIQTLEKQEIKFKEKAAFLQQDVMNQFKNSPQEQAKKAAGQKQQQ